VGAPAQVGQDSGGVQEEATLPQFYRELTADGLAQFLGNAESLSYLSFIQKIIPSDPITPFTEHNVLAICFMATALGLAIGKLKDETKAPLKNAFLGFFNALLLISKALIKVLPLAVFAFSYQFVKNFSAF